MNSHSPPPCEASKLQSAEHVRSGLVLHSTSLSSPSHNLCRTFSSFPTNFQSHHHHHLMTDRYKQLLEERASARAVLDASAAWVAWKAADAAVQSTIEMDDVRKQSAPRLVPEEVVGLTDSFAPWDEQDPVLCEYMRVRRVEDLREQLMDSGEWRSFQAAQQRLVVFVREELAKKKEVLETRRWTSRSLAHSEGPPLQPSSASSSTTVPDAEAAGSVATFVPPGVSALTGPLSAVVLSTFDPAEQGSKNCTSPAALLSKDADTTSAVESASRSTPAPEDSAVAGWPAVRYPQREQAVSEEVVSSAPVAASDLSPANSNGTAPLSTIQGASANSASSTPSCNDTRIQRSAQRSSPLPQHTPPRSSLSKLKMPSWCLQIVEDGSAVLHANQLGLVDHEVRKMCGSVRPQVQRIWCERGPRSLLAALVTAQRFTAASWSHPTHQQMDEVRQRVHDAVEGWSDDQFLAVVTEYGKAEYVSRFLTESSEGQLDLSFLLLFQAADPARPTVYVFSVTSHAGPGHASLDVIGEHNAPDRRCLVLYRHVSSDRHFEAVSWKPSRGATPLTTSFTGSHELIVALRRWKRDFNTPSPSPTRKRKRTASEMTEVIDVEQDEPSPPELGVSTPSS